MCFYHSEAIKIEIDDLLEVLDLNQIVNKHVSKITFVKFSIKWLVRLCLHVRITVLLIACKNKGNKAHGS